MKRTQKLVGSAVLTALLMQSTGCGYILYPERRGQGAGQIDPAVAIMDGLGLLLWILPGVVAFAVDYTNGTLYLPGGKKGADIDMPDIEIQVVNKADLRDREKLEALLSKELGYPVDLDAASVRVHRYENGSDAIKLVQQAQWQVHQSQYAAR